MTDTPMTPDRLAEYRALIARTTDAGALVASPGVLRDLLAEVDRLREELSDATAELAENTRAMNVLRRHRDTAESRLAAVERLAEEADDKCNSTVDTDLLLDALGLSADAPPGARLTGLPAGLTGRARHEARVAIETARRTPKESPAGEGSPEPDMPVLAGKDWGGPLARCSWGRHLAALLPNGHIGTHRMGEGWLNRCPGVGKPPRADDEATS